MSAQTNDQVSRLLENNQEEQRLDDGISPIMPFPTACRLTRNQEEEIVNHAMRRLEELENETGRGECGAFNWWNEAPMGMSVQDPEGRDLRSKTWMGKRYLYDLTYRNEVDWRASLLGGVFMHSNLVVPVARRITRQMIARGTGYFFGTSPWFAAYPVGELDRDRADKADRFIRWKTDKSKLKRTGELAIERAFVVGEAVVKTTHDEKKQIFETMAEILIDQTGNPVLGADGDFIFKADLWIQDAAQDPETGEVVTSGLFLLKRDGQTPKPEVMLWEKRLITRRITHYSGPRSKVIHFLDFLCPLEAETVQDADCVVHLYDMPLMELADNWKKAIPDNATAEEQQAAVKNAIEMIRLLSSTSGETTSGQNSNTVDASVNNAGTKTIPVAEIAEFHLRYDWVGDGILRDIMLVVDRKTRCPIFYDYEANVTEDGLRPFSVVRVNEVPGRWYGIGSMEMFNTSQQIIDLLTNRVNFSNSGASRVDFWNPAATIEGRADSNLKLNRGRTYTLAPGKTAKDALESVYLENNVGDNWNEMTEFFMQLMMNESGVSNANDGQAAGLESTKLATGIRNLEKSGQELFSLHLGHIEPGVEEMLGKEVKIIMVHLDPTETGRFFEEGEGGEGVGAFVQVNAGDVNNMELDTRILLTRYRGEQLLESSLRAWETVEKYYAQPTAEIQMRTAPMARDILKAFQVQGADDIIQPLSQPITRQGPMPSGGPPPSASNKTTPNL